MIGLTKTTTVHATLILTLAVAFCAAGDDNALSLTCTRASHRYRIEETAEFLVNSPQPGATVEVRFCRVRKEPLSVFVTTTPARVSFALGKPGLTLADHLTPLNPIVFIYTIKRLDYTPLSTHPSIHQHIPNTF